MRRSFRFITLLLLLLVTLPFFFVGGPDWLSSPLYRALWDLGHFIFFALVLVLVQLYRPLAHWQQWVWVGCLVLLVGGIIELLQAYVGRDGTWSDVLHNLIGAALGLFWGQKPDRQIWIGRLLGSLALLPSVALTAQIALVQYESAQQFPLLAGFETERELLRWKGKVSRTDKYASQGRFALQVSFATTKYSGIAFTHFLGDWDSYNQLAMDIYNPDLQPLELVLRVHDAAHDRAGGAYNDRFNTRLLIQPGWNYLAVELADIKQAPAQRQMNLQQLRALGLFTVELPEARVMYLDNIRLE